MSCFPLGRCAARRPAAQGIILRSFITADLKVCSTPFRLTVWSLRLRFDYFLLDLKANKW